MATDPKSSSDNVISDKIMEELESFREAYAAQFDYDIEKMFADVREFGETNPVAPIALIKPAERKPQTKIGDATKLSLPRLPAQWRYLKHLA